MTRPDETIRSVELSRRNLLKTSAGGLGTYGLAGCVGGDGTQDLDSPGTDADTPKDAPTAELDLETLEAETEYGTLQAKRAENSYVSQIDDGEVIGIAFLDEVGAEEEPGDIVVHLYESRDLAVMSGEVDSEGAATLESEELSDFDATIDLVMGDDEVTGTVTFAGGDPTEFTASASTDRAGVYWAHGTDEEPDVSADWVVFSDGSQWGCACLPPFRSPCCTLGRS